MKPEEVSAALARVDARVLAGARPDTEALLKSAKSVAANVRALAGREGAAIGIRVKATERGVRVTVTGPRAGRYRALIERALAQRVPQDAAEVRARVTGRR